MPEYSETLSKGNLKEVIPYLLKYYFENNPTSNKDLREAFWKLMGKNVEIHRTIRWTDGKRGVPSQIDQLIKDSILTKAPDQEYYNDLEYPQYTYLYELGEKGEKEINDLLNAFPKEFIEKEIETYLRKPQQITIPES
jgi:hypothetical protein